MTNKLISSLLVLSTLVAVSHAVAGTLGSTVAVTANTQTTIEWSFVGGLVAGPTLVVTSSADGAVKLSSYLNLATALIDGFSGLSIDVAVGFTLEASGGAVITQATLTSPTLSANQQTTLSTAGNLAGVVMYDASATTYTRLKIEPYTTETPKISVVLPSPFVGTYLFVSVKDVVTVPYATARACYANANQTLAFSTDTVITFKSRVSASLTVAKASVTTKGTEAQRAAIGTSAKVYLTITATGAGGAAVAHDSVIQYKYTADQMTAASISSAMEANLCLAFYNEATANWEVPASGGSVDVATKTVTQSTTHFSEWGLYARNSAKAVAASLSMIMALALSSIMLSQ